LKELFKRNFKELNEAQKGVYAVFFMEFYDAFLENVLLSKIRIWWNEIILKDYRPIKDTLTYFYQNTGQDK